MDPTVAGGSAFPLPLGTANCAEPNESGGMYLRDYFAAKAIEGACVGELPDPLWLDVAAKRAYMLADAVLLARSV